LVDLKATLRVGAADLTLLLLAMFCLRLEEYKATLIVSISERNIDNLDSAVRFCPSKREARSYANTSISNTKCAISGMTRDSKINQTLSNQTRNYLNDVISYLTGAQKLRLHHLRHSLGSHFPSASPLINTRRN